MSPELILGLATLALSSAGAGGVLGFHVRGLIPVRAPSNRVRLENAKTDAQIEAERSKAQLESARSIAEMERLDLETNYTRARARLETSKVEVLANPAGDDVDILIRARRSELGWTQKDLGNRTGLRPVRISALENGASPTVDELRKIADATDLEFVPARLARTPSSNGDAPFARALSLPAASIDAGDEEDE